MSVPRVGICYDNKSMGRDDGPPLYWRFQLKKLEEEGLIESVFFFPNGDFSTVGKLDLLIWVDWGEDAVQPHLPYRIKVPDSAPIAYVSSDTHLGWKYRRDFARKHAKYAYFNQKRAVEEYGEPNEGQTVSWLPHAFEPAVWRPGVWNGTEWADAVPKKKWDWCMVGHMQTAVNPNGMTRLDAIDRLYREFPDGYYGSRDPYQPGKNMFEDAASTFNASRAVFNISIGDDVNMRDFEALGTRSCMVRNRIDTIGEIFEDGTHFIGYSDYDSMVEAVRRAKDNPKEASAIAEAGYAESMAKHTYRHRVLRVLTDAGILPGDMAPPLPFL